MARHARHHAHAHYDHVGAFYHPGLGETFTPSTVTFMDVRAGTSTIRRGAKSDAVGQLQALLNALKFSDSRGRPLATDKLFGPNTEFALKAAQTATKVAPSGILDKATLAALEALQVGAPAAPPAAPLPAPVEPVAPPAVAETAPWWKSPWVLGGGAVALVALVALVGSGDDTSSKT